MIKISQKIPRSRWVFIFADFVIITYAFFASLNWFQLTARPEYALALWAFFLAVKMGLSFHRRVYHAILRHAGLPMAENLLVTYSLSLIVVFLATRYVSENLFRVPSGFLVLDYLMSMFLCGLIRFLPRYVFDFLQDRENETPFSSPVRFVLIYGAGELGGQVARKLAKTTREYHVVGYMDDDPGKRGKQLHGFPVLGGKGDLSGILGSRRRAGQSIDELIIAIEGLPRETIREVTLAVRPYQVLCRIVPSFADMIRPEISIKKLEILDLLRRNPKDLDRAQIASFVSGKVVMISGAGGTIGSELARQCLRYGASRLVLLDHSEYNLYAIEEEMRERGAPASCVLLNVMSPQLEQVMAQERPEIFFHAAAYKHVPIVEASPREGIYNNVRGTMVAAQAAVKHGVRKFVLISTDKAVRPTSVMGATKRVAEIYIQALNARLRSMGRADAPEFLAVRFGNVLGSSGSVIPKFIDQINKGGPVTVTHPEVTRYFMLISEAVQLVLQAASIGKGGEIFILNMGSPVKIAQMAEDLIFLSGHQPHQDIKIDYTGLRPGEKLYEELLLDGTEMPTPYPDITIARPREIDWDTLNGHLQSLFEALDAGNHANLSSILVKLVPEYIKSDK